MPATNRTSIIRSRFVKPALAAGVAFVISLPGCRRDSQQVTEPPAAQGTEIPETGEQLMCEAIDAMTSIAEWTGYSGSQPALCRVPAGSGNIAADSVFVYGAITASGLGVVVTERHTHPKGLLLITVRRSYGIPGRIVSEVAQFDSYEGFRAGQPSVSTVTEVCPASRDTIVTHVIRNGITETYTFRLPVVTRVDNQVARTVRITSRYASAGGVVTEVTDENQSLIRRTTNSALPTGALCTRTDLPDGSWKIVTSLGNADGSVSRGTVSGH
jgi:hypothetical protein